MRVIVQRVTRASVEIDGAGENSIGGGLVVLLGVSKTDTPADAEYLAGKVTSLRIFADEQGKLNRSLVDIAGELLIVSNFTLYGDTRRGRRPSFDAAAPPAHARGLYDYFVQCARSYCPVQTGQFQTHMLVKIENDGPITLILESQDGRGAEF